jgi:hypothetical protein
VFEVIAELPEGMLYPLDDGATGKYVCVAPVYVFEDTGLLTGLEEA